jgi:hypothetical protein
LSVRFRVDIGVGIGLGIGFRTGVGIDCPLSSAQARHQRGHGPRGLTTICCTLERLYWCENWRRRRYHIVMPMGCTGS